MKKTKQILVDAEQARGFLGIDQKALADLVKSGGLKKFGKKYSLQEIVAHLKKSKTSSSKTANFNQKQRARKLLPRAVASLEKALKSQSGVARVQAARSIHELAGDNEEQQEEIKIQFVVITKKDGHYIETGEAVEG